MDQVSRPMLIALAATVALAALWLVVLRPTSSDVVGTPATPVGAVAKAEQASATSDAANAAVQSATGGTEAAPAADAAPAPATAAPAAPSRADVKASSKREAAVLRELRAGKVVVMLFWNSKGADDIATRAAVRDLDRRDGKVRVHVVPISRVADYAGITEGVTVNQSPTTIVIDRKRRARAIVGLTESRELSQAVGDAVAGRK